MDTTQIMHYKRNISLLNVPTLLVYLAISVAVEIMT